MNDPKVTSLFGERGYNKGQTKQHDGGDGGGSDMLEGRVANLESDVSVLKSDVSVLKSDVKELRKELGDLKVEMREGFANLRSDFHEANTKLVMWIVGTGAAISIGFITIMTFVLNNAIPKAQPASAQPPIIINVPSQQAAPAPEAPKPPTP